MRYRIASYVGCKDLRNKTKTMVISIVMTMVVMLVFASTAMAITVDGVASPGEWDPNWKLADDLNDVPPLAYANGFNISSVWQHYEDDTLYFMYKTVGIAGDSSGNGHPSLPDDNTEQPGVGRDEMYVVGIDIDNDASTGTTMMGGYPGFDLIVKYQDSTVTDTWYGTTEPSGFEAKALIKLDEPYDHVVEFSMNKVSEYMDTRNYALYGFAGSLIDTQNPEDPLTEPIEVTEFDFECEGICCFNMSFTGTSCGNIANHTWTFDDGTTSGVISGAPEDAPFLYHQYSSGGYYDVTLSGYNANGDQAAVTKHIYVDMGPTAAISVNPTEIDGATLVTFDGSGSHTDLRGEPRRDIVSWEWSFSDGDAKSGEVVTKTVTTAMVPLTATLTVSDSHCIDDVSVTVKKKPGPTGNEVPILTPAGMLVLVGLLCIVGGSRLLNRGRRS